VVLEEVPEELGVYETIALFGGECLFLSVVSHLFVIPILVFWVGLEKTLNNQTWM
jgi:hypothetical protein